MLQALGVPARFEGDSPTGSPIKSTTTGGLLHPHSSGLGVGLGLASVSLLSPQASQALSTPGKGLGLGGAGPGAAAVGAGATGGGLIGGLGLTNPRGPRGAPVATPLLPGGPGASQGKGTALTMFSNDSGSQSTHPTVGGTEGVGIASLAGQTGAGPTPLTLSTASLTSPTPVANAGTAGGGSSTGNSLYPMPMSPLGIAGGGGGTVLLLSPTGNTSAFTGVGVGLLGNMGGPGSSSRGVGAGHAGAPSGGQGLDRDLAQLTWWSRLLKLSTVLSAKLAAALVFDATAASSSFSSSFSAIDSGVGPVPFSSSSSSSSTSMASGLEGLGASLGSLGENSRLGVPSTGTPPPGTHTHTFTYSQYNHVISEEMALMLKTVDRHGVWMYIACPARLARHLLTPPPLISNTNHPLMLPFFESPPFSSMDGADDDDGDDVGVMPMPMTTASYGHGNYQDLIVETAKELRDKEALVDHGYRMILQVMRNSQGKTVATLSSSSSPATTTAAATSLAPPTACDLLFGIEHCLLMAAQRVQGTCGGTGARQRGDTFISGAVGKSGSGNSASSGNGVGGCGVGGVQMVNQNSSIWRAIARFTKKLHARRSPLLQGSYPYPIPTLSYPNPTTRPNPIPTQPPYVNHLPV